MADKPDSVGRSDATRGLDMERCTWCLCNEKMIRYHDEEWGVPLHDDGKQFEFLMMEVMQCGLNWNMMIQKREIFRECFDGFDYQKGGTPAKNGLSDMVSRDLKKRGFKYLGSVTVYSHLQACGIVNDHADRCFRYQEVMEGSQTVRKRRKDEG